MITQEKLKAALDKCSDEYFSLKRGNNKSYNEYLTEFLIKHKLVRISEQNINKMPDAACRKGKVGLLEVLRPIDTHTTGISRKNHKKGGIEKTGISCIAKRRPCARAGVPELESGRMSLKRKG